MRHLRRAAQLWVWLILAAGGAAVLVGLALQPSQMVAELSGPTLWVFLSLAALAHAFPVIAPRHQAYHATHAFLMATILLLSWPAVVLVVVVSHATEWIRRRRPWYIQLYNVAAYLLSAGAAALALHWLLPDLPFSLGGQSALAILAAIAAAVVFLVVNHGLTALVLRLARDVSVADSGLFGWESLGVDGALLLVGILMADAWIEQPLSLIVTSAPLVLFYRALRLPSLELAAHRDRLTGLYNARHFGEALDHELIRARYFGQPTSFVVAAIDDVQQTLQRYGRASLDFLAIALTERVAGAAREYDLVARLGEGSFGLLFPNTGPTGASELVQCVVDAVAGRPYDLPTTRESVSISVSAALTTLPAGSPVARGLVAYVERAAERSRLTGPRSVLVVDPELLPDRATESRQPGRLEPRPVAPATVPPAAGASARAWVSLPFLELVVVLPALGLSLTLVVLDSLPSLEMSAAIVCLVVISELLAFELYDRSSFSISFAPIVAAGLLAGPDGAMLATWSIALARGLLRRTRWDKVLFNGSAFTLFGLAAVSIKAARRSVDVAEVVHRVLAAFTAQAALSGHTFEADVPAALPRVYADSTQVERVLRNLVSNALKYAPHGGLVRITAIHAGKGEIEVRVEDRGLGIPPEWLGRLFERFERVNTPERASIRGTGLGLYIARQMVELNGGRIWATSDGRGRGATFHFTLCVVPAARGVTSC